MGLCTFSIHKCMEQKPISKVTKKINAIQINNLDFKWGFLDERQFMMLTLSREIICLILDLDDLISFYF